MTNGGTLSNWGAPVGKDKKMVERRTQLFFRDDNKFEFIKRPLKFSCLAEMKGDAIKRAWKHFYGNQIPFSGYKGISADSVTLGFGRDIILDPFDKVPKTKSDGDLTGKPDLGSKDALRKWIAKIAENQRSFYRAKRESTLMADRVSWTLIGIIFLFALGWIIRFATG